MNMRYNKIYALLLAAMVTAGVATTQDAAAQVTIKGSVYGGGNAADVKVNTIVNIGGGTIDKNVYGGGNLGDVGTIVKSADYNYKWTNDATADPIVWNNTGVCNVTITEQSDNTTTISGNVFGAGKGVANTFWCEKGMVYKSIVNISKGSVNGNVYGGGEVGRVENDSQVTIGVEGEDEGESAPVIDGSVFGAGAGLETHGYSALVRNNTEVTVQGNAKVGNGTNGGNVYGGGEIAAVGRYGLDGSGMPTTLVSGGECKVTVKGYAKIGPANGGEVFGAGKGVVPHYYIDVVQYTDTADMPKRMMTYNSTEYQESDKGKTWDYYGSGTDYVWEYFDTKTKYLNFLQTLALATDTKVSIEGSTTVNGSVYGGSESGFVQRFTDVQIKGGEIGTATTEGNVFGGGKGLTGNDDAGRVSGSVTLYILGGTTHGSVYGGGALGKVNTNKTLANNDYPTTSVNLLGGTITGDAYGGGLGDATTAADVGNTKVNLNGMSLSEYNSLSADFKTQLSSIIVAKDVDTPQDDADYYMTSGKGCIVNRIFGANNTKGTPLGNVTVHVYATQNKSTSKPNVGTKYVSDKVVNENFEDPNVSTDDLKKILADKIEIAEIPELSIPASTIDNYKGVRDDDDATVDQFKTAITGITEDISNAANTDAKLAAINKLRFDVQAVYGGGNEANYDPTSPYTTTNTTGSKTQVIIEGCEETSIETVYGGGNAAAVPETNVDVKSCYEIETVFGGGNGKDATSYGDNLGADVGTKDHGVSADNNYGTGNTNVNVEGGYIYEVYGASNEKGIIKGSPKVETEDAGICAMLIGTIYNAGKNADVDGNLIAILGCKPGSKINEYYGGAQNANVKGNVELTITSGNFGKVFAGNKTSGAIFGHIKVNIEETGNCAVPITIDELYGCGNDAAYSVYGYVQGRDPDTGELLWMDDAKTRPFYVPRTKAEYDALYATIKDKTPEEIAADDDLKATAALLDGLPYDDPEVNIISCTSIGKVFGGGYGTGATVYGNPMVNINMIKGTATGSLDALGTIGDVYGGGNAAKVLGNTTVNIGTEPTVQLHELIKSDGTYQMSESKNVLGAKITGNVYGGGKLADVGYLDDDTKENDPNSVYCNTFVNIGAREVTESEAKVWKSVAVGVTILGNVYGGGEGEANASTYKCDKAMVVGNTNVRIGNGTVGTLDNNDKLDAGTGNVYGGGEIGRVERSSTVTIGFETGTSQPVIRGSVFGAGSGVTTHGYSALVRGNSEVTIQGNAKVDGSVYGGGETASVGRYHIATTQALATQYNVEIGEPYGLISGGKSTVTIQGNAEIGPDDMKMTATGGPDDAGHVFGAGKGVLPYQNLGTEGAGRYYLVNDVITWEPYGETNEDDYEKYMLTLALSDNTDVTIAGNAFVKGSVYGGSENGHVRTNTVVNIDGGQIGAGYNKDTGKSLSKYNDGQFIDPATTEVEASNALKTCAAWPYDKATTGKPYDMYAIYYNETDGEYYYDSGYEQSSEGGADAAHANDGHTFYGNVFGGGSGYYPYAPGKWLESAGSVGGNTVLNITGGHILSNVYGGNEQTNVEGSCTITMSGGTIGVPRTKEQIQDHPVVGNLFGAGKGDKRVLFNTWTNVASTSITISGGIVYGSVFGGGEDGHVINNATTLIQEASGKTITIGSTGESGADGNVFGGGRGSETALTAGVVGGNVSLTINSGNIKGSVYGGGRLASVGTNFVNPDDEDLYGKLQTPDADHGNITIEINNGTIGNANSTGISGNIYGGSKGTTSDFRLGIVRSTTINMTDGTAYASVYGGGELAQVVGSHTTSGEALGTEINISGGTIGTAKANLPEGTTYGATYGNVYGGGKGNTTHVEAGLIKTNTKVSISQADSKTTLIRHNIYGGGAYGSVGEFNYDGTTGMPTGRKENTTGGKATIVIASGTIGEDGHENGMIFGSSRGDVGAPGEVHDKLAWVYDTEVTVNDGQIKGSVYGGGENGHVYHDAAVNVHGGTIGISDDPNYAYRGNVYGGGCGTDKYYTSTTGVTNPQDGNGNKYNPLAGIVYGDATVLIDGGHVVHNVYGAGAMGSVGTITNFDDLDDDTKNYKHDDETNDEHKSLYNFGLSWPYEFIYGNTGLTKVTIEGTAVIGVSGSTGGHVYGAARGSVDVGQTDITDQRYEEAKLANVREVQVVIGTEGGSSTTTTPTIHGSVYGGGEDGHVNQNASITIHHGTIAHSVFGGGKGTSTYTTTLWDPDKADETDDDNKKKASSEPVHSWTAGKVYGNTTITMNGGSVGYSIYGGGNMASVGKGNYAGGSDDYSTVGYGELPPSDDGKLWTNTNFTGSGLATVNIYGGTVGAANTTYEGLPTGNVFGSSRGVAALSCNISPRYKYVPDFFLGYVNQTSVTIGKSDGETTPTIYGSVYGGGENGHVRRSTEVTINKGTIGVENDVSENKLDRGNVFGAGSGVGKNSADEYNTSSGSVTCTTTVTVNNGTIYQNVYGGGAQGSVGPPPGGITADETNSESSVHKTYTKVEIKGGNIGSTNNAEGYGGNVYGASRGNASLNAAVYATDVWSTVNVTNGIINGSVFGGGENGIVKCGVAVSMTGGEVKHDVYGGGALADTQTSNWDATKNSGAGGWAEGKTSASYTTAVNLIAGLIGGNAYGGGLGKMAVGTEGQSGYEPAIEAKVYGNTIVELNKDVPDDTKGCIVRGSIFGCNNLSGSPQGTATVHVYKTQRYGATRITNGGDEEGAKVWGTKDEKNNFNLSSFDVQSVYGGGNLAAYEPAATVTTGTDDVKEASKPAATVIIDGCERTSIGHVYGGGNAAPTPATNVTVNGTFEIGELFGGGNGADKLPNGDNNPGANVGFRTYPDNVPNKTDTPENRATYYGYGSGKAEVNVFGGTIHRVFGGSNTKGNVRKTAVTMLDDKSECTFCVDEAYGGGKNAPMDAEAKLLMACIPGLQAAYGGAENADVQNNVILTVTNGTFDRIFGGNNLSGTIRGSITVNIEETGCRPLIIGELYGGGNEAAYSIYGYDSDGKPVVTGTTPLYDDPQVNVKSFTSIGKIFGGGYGDGATMVGNPTVNVNEAYGKYYNNDQSIVGENEKTPNNYPIPSHAKGKIGAINTVFGGGNAAKVIGNTNVNIGTLAEVYVVKEVAVDGDVSSYYTRKDDGTYEAASGTAQEGVTYYEKKDVIGVDIRGNVYGGGNNAEVTGDTNVTIGKQAE